MSNLYCLNFVFIYVLVGWILLFWTSSSRTPGCHISHRTMTRSIICNYIFKLLHHDNVVFWGFGGFVQTRRKRWTKLHSLSTGAFFLQNDIKCLRRERNTITTGFFLQIEAKQKYISDSMSHLVLTVDEKAVWSFRWQKRKERYERCGRRALFNTVSILLLVHTESGFCKSLEERELERGR